MKQVSVSEELLRQAIDAYDSLLPTLPGLQDNGSRWLRNRLIKATDDLRAALDAPAVEPEAWYDGRKFYATPSAAHMDCADIKALRPLYEAPQAQQPVVEPVPMLTDEEIDVALHVALPSLPYDSEDAFINGMRAGEQLVRQKAGIK